MQEAKIWVVSLQRHGGGALDSLGLSNGLCANAFEHGIIISGGNERISQFSDNAYRHVIKIKTYKGKWTFLLSLLLLRPLRLISIMAKERPSVVHITHFHIWTTVLFMARPFFGYRIIYGVHEDPYRVKDATNSIVMRRIERIFIKKADMVVTYSEFMRHELSGRVPEIKLRAIPLGAYDYFCPDFQRKMHAMDEPLHLFFFGPIKEYKGVDVLVRAMSVCAERKVRAVLTIAGSQAADLHIIDEDEVRMLGIIWINRYIPDGELCRLLGDTDVMIVPYRDATQTTPGALALGYGIPMIATRSGGLAEQVEDGASGILIPPDDSESLARAIEKIAAERDLLERFREGARKLYQKKFSWAVIARELTDIYRNSVR